MFVELTERGLFVDGALSDVEYTKVSFYIGKYADLSESIDVPEDGFIVWDFKYECGANLLFDDGYLAILENGLRFFSEKVYPNYSERTLYCILGEFESIFPDSLRIPFAELSFLEAMRSKVTLFQYRLEGYEALASKLQMLATELPLDLQSSVLISGDLTLSERGYFLSKNVFEHIFPFNSGKAAARQALLLPAVESVDEDLLDHIDGVDKDVRLIPENRAVEMWDELDELVYFEKYEGPLGKRALQGFEAAGGTSIRFEDLLTSCT